MASNLATHAATGLISALVTGLVSYYVWRPDAHAQFYCRPSYEGPAPLTVSCFNESQYARSIVWDFGDGSPSERRDQVTHTYAVGRPDPYLITITAIGKGGNKSLVRHVRVERAAQAAALPVRVSLMASLVGAPETVKRCHVNLVNDEHNSAFSVTSRTFTSQACESDAGGRIVNARFQVDSVTRASEPRILLSDDRKSATVATRLTSGPRVDRYRGWLRGVLEITQKLEESAREPVMLARDISVQNFSNYRLETALEASSVEKISVTANGQAVGNFAVNEWFTIPGVQGQARVIEGDQGIQLAIARSRD